MSFSSMLQMARGRDPPSPQMPQSSPADKKGGLPARTSAAGKASSKPSLSKEGAAAQLPKRPPAMPAAPSSSRDARPAITPKQAATAKPPPIAKASPPASSAIPKPATKVAASRHANAEKPSSFTQKRAVSSGSASSGSSSVRDAAPGDANNKVTKKKLSFKDVMDQASKVNTAKLEVKLRTKDSRKQPETPPPSRRPRLQPVDRRTTDSSEKPSKPVSPPTADQKSRRSSPAPVAQPFPEILGKRQRQLEARMAPSRKRIEEEEDLSDFIASEDEEDVPPDSHEEIWRLFNRGPKQRYIDYDSDDDMEARGDDILNEERRSALQARREDAEEERKLSELAQRKQLQRRRSS